jgi:hypothetical protein
MNYVKERQLLQLMIRVCRGARVGPDLELAEAAARRERQLLGEVERIDREEAPLLAARQSEPAHAHAA